MTTKTTPRKHGRPTMYTHELALAICDALEQGKTLIDIAEPANMPDTSTIRQWMVNNANGEFAAMSARAREAGADALVAEAQRLLDDATRDDIMVVRERVAHLRWRATRLNPRRYGDRAQIDLSGDLAVKTDVRDEAPSWIKEKIAERAAAASAGTVKH